MARYRLRHGATELELPAGEFVIGRSTQCNLTLDDSLVSRRHVRIFHEGTDLVVEDLGSRNGFMLNGAEVRTRATLRHLDRLKIGSHDLVVLDVDSESKGPAQTVGFCRMCGSPLGAGDRRCSVCGTAAGAGGVEHATVELQLPDELRRTQGTGARGTAFALVGNIASKALALGRVDEAERMLGPLLDSIEKRIAAGESIDPTTIRESIDFAVKLTDGSNGVRWVTWLLHVHAALRRVPEALLVDQLHEVVRRVRYGDSKAVARLIEAISTNANLSPADRFVIKRLESLQRVISA